MTLEKVSTKYDIDEDDETVQTASSVSGWWRGVLLGVVVQAVFWIAFSLMGISDAETGLGAVSGMTAIFSLMGYFLISPIFALSLYKDAKAVEKSSHQWSPNPVFYAVMGLFTLAGVVMFELTTIPLVVGGYYLYKRFSFRLSSEIEADRDTPSSRWWYVILACGIVVGSIQIFVAATILYFSTFYSAHGGLTGPAPVFVEWLKDNITKSSFMIFFILMLWFGVFFTLYLPLSILFPIALFFDSRTFVKSGKWDRSAYLYSLLGVIQLVITNGYMDIIDIQNMFDLPLWVGVTILPIITCGTAGIYLFQRYRRSGTPAFPLFDTIEGIIEN